MKTTLRDRLYRYLLRQHGYVSSGELEKIVMQETNYTAANVSRRLRELRAAGLIKRELRKGHAFYAAVRLDMPLEAPKLPQDTRYPQEAQIALDL